MPTDCRYLVLDKDGKTWVCKRYPPASIYPSESWPHYPIVDQDSCDCGEYKKKPE